jgi:hypothetical protein
VILLAAWAIAIIYAFPGYMNFDASEQLYQARTRIDDWHPPMMAAYWKVLEVFVRGPFLMLVLQTSLFLWGLYVVLRTRLAPRTAAIVTAVMFVFPPILTPMAPVWKDAQMAAFLIAGVMLAVRRNTLWRIAGCVLFVLAVGVRDNGAAALLPLLVIVTTAWFPRRLHYALATVGLFVALNLVAMGANRMLTQVRAYPWYLSTAMHDIAGTICHEDALTDRAILDATKDVVVMPAANLQARICKAYNPRVWFELAYGATQVFDSDPYPTDRDARGAAWRKIVTEHPHAYLSHRWAVTRELLGLTSAEPWEPVCQTFTATKEQRTRLRHDASRSWFQKIMGSAFGVLAKTPLYRPWIYMLLALALLGYALAKKRGFIALVVASGVLYELGLFAFAAAPDFRYSHWMITCTCIGAALVFAERWKAGVR